MRELGARGVNLADDLAARITAWSAEGGDSRARFGSRLGVLLQMPIIGPDGVTTGATDNVAFLTLATIGDTGIALGRLDRSPQSMKGGSRYTRLITPAVVDQGKLAAMPLLMGTAHVEFDRVRAAELSGKTADRRRELSKSAPAPSVRLRPKSSSERASALVGLRSIPTFCCRIISLATIFSGRRWIAQGNSSGETGLGFCVPT